MLAPTWYLPGVATARKYDKGPGNLSYHLRLPFVKADSGGWGNHGRASLEGRAKTQARAYKFSRNLCRATGPGTEPGGGNHCQIGLNPLRKPHKGAPEGDAAWHYQAPIAKGKRILKN